MIDTSVTRTASHIGSSLAINLFTMYRMSLNVLLRAMADIQGSMRGNSIFFPVFTGFAS